MSAIGITLVSMWRRQQAQGLFEAPPHPREGLAQARDLVRSAPIELGRVVPGPKLTSSAMRDIVRNCDPSLSRRVPR